MRLAFIGFRHSHILALYRAAGARPDITIAAACEEDCDGAATVLKDSLVELTHDDYPRMLDAVPCDAVAIGDYYARRGRIAIDALQRGKHVIADKPLCTSLDEYQQIARLARDKKLAVGCMLDMRCGALPRTVRRLIQSGTIGPVRTVNFTAQHPLLLGKRPQWYFEPGKHGGTINDIGIHAFDAIPWMTGRKITQVIAARAWNARLPQFPHFQDGAQVMLRLDNGGGVLGDLSYLAPDRAGYSAPQYWRQTFHGDKGVLEIDGASKFAHLILNDEPPRDIPPDAAADHCYLDAFLRESRGENRAAGEELPITAEEVLAATKISLAIQQAADENRCHVSL